MRGLLGGRWVRQALALALLLVVWEVRSRSGLIDPFYATPPSTVAATLIELFAGGAIWEPYRRDVLGRAPWPLGGLVLGALLGFGAAMIPPLADVLEPPARDLGAAGSASTSARRSRSAWCSSRC